MVEGAERVVIVEGEGVASGTPDRCNLFLALQSRDQTPSEALDSVTTAAAAVLDALKAAGVPESDLRTAGLTVQEWIQPGPQGPRPEGYVAHYSLSVVDRTVGTTAELVAVATAVGGDSLRVNGIHLAFSDLGPLQREARQRAVEDARRRAEDLAAAAGIRLGPTLRIEEGPTRGLGNLYKAAASAARASPSVPVEPGTGNVTAMVTVTFAIED